MLGDKYLPALSEALAPCMQHCHPARTEKSSLFAKNKQTQVFQNFRCSEACAALKGTQVIMVGKYTDDPLGVQIHTRPCCPGEHLHNCSSGSDRYRDFTANLIRGLRCFQRVPEELCFVRMLGLGNEGCPILQLAIRARNRTCIYALGGGWVTAMEKPGRRGVTASLPDHRFVGTSQTPHSKFIKYLISAGEKFQVDPTLLIFIIKEVAADTRHIWQHLCWIIFFSKFIWDHITNGRT